MEKFKHCVLWLALLLCSATWVYGQGKLPSERKERSFQKEYHGLEAQKRIPGAVYVKDGKNTPYPSFVRFSETKQVAYSEFFAWLQATLKLNPDVSFVLKADQVSEKIGMHHYRYTQTYKGVPVAQGQYIVHVKDGMVKYFNGDIFNVPAMLSPAAALTEADALEAAKRQLGVERYKWEDEYWENRIKERKQDASATYFPKGELCWQVDNFFKEGQTPTYHLAYMFDISAAVPAYEKRVYIDANTGTMLKVLAMESNCEAATTNTIWNGNRGINTYESGGDYYLLDDCQSAEIEIRRWGSSDCTSSPGDITNTTNTWNNTTNETFGSSVLWAAKQSYRYWLNEQGRDSYDDGGGDVDGYINAVFTNCWPDCFPSCRYTDNASMSFTGGTMKVGLGSSMTLTNSWGALDIIGHEFTHAVTGSGTAAQLVYQNESGALNESFSDIFGEMTERYVLGNADYLMGDDRDDGYIRNMGDPKDKNDPDTYGGTNWCDYTNGTLNCTMNDAGGVHTNSGVQNRWFFLLTFGGTGTNDNGDDFSVSGVGADVAAFISMVNLLDELSSNSDYSDARAGAIQAAIDYYGSCSNVVKQVTNAWYAVGVGGQFIELDISDSDYNGSDVTCAGACDGTATAEVTGGTAEVYEWSPGGATTSTITNLCAGNYSVTVTDLAGLGCSVSADITISDPPALSVSISSPTHNGYNISCNGGSDGIAIANPSGGTGAKTYQWSDGQTSKSATGLTAGSYTVTVTDANGCATTADITLTEPPQLLVTVDATSDYNGYDVRCHGGSDGVAEAFPSGGVGGYIYDWSNGATTKEATGLSAETYTVTVTDNNECTVSGDVTLTEPPQLTLDAGDNKIVYYGYPDSACAKLTYSGEGGGVPPYTITWSTGSTANPITVCPIVTTRYDVTITDLNNCSFYDSVKVCAIDVRCGRKLDNVVLCHKAGGDTGTITICVDKKGAKAHFTYHPGIDQLASCGTLKVCSFTGPSAKTESDVLNETEQALHSGLAYLGAFPNPFTDNTTIRFTLPNDDHVVVQIFDVSGKQVAELYRGETRAGEVHDLSFDGSRYSNGIYVLTMKPLNSERIIDKIILAR